MNMRLHVIGSSPAWPNPGGAHSGYLVECDGRRLLLDCGPGVLSRLRQGEQWPELDAIAITHFHLDHWGDLVPWVWGSMYRSRDGELHKPDVWVYKGGHEYLENLGTRLGFPDMFDRVFIVKEYTGGQPFEAGGFEVHPIRLPHYRLETYGFRVSRNGSTLAYSGDSGPSDALAELARDADLFVCEATLERGELDGEPRGHLDIEEALDAYAKSGARRLLLTHRPSELSVPDGLEAAYDGMQLTIEQPAARSAGSSR
jgi:ribonuclease BN (tRNA processing enzyme)